MNAPPGTYLFYCIILPFVILQSCAVSRTISPKQKKELHQLLTDSPRFSKSYTGLQVYDLSEKQVIYEKNADHYFTPASNTKILTYYVAEKILSDTIPALKYIVQGDSLVFWGTGDPTLLHPDFPRNDEVIRFLRSRKEKLFYCSDNFTTARYGSGWMWDDYTYYFQTELSAMPVYGNTISIHGEKFGNHFTVQPGYFADKIRENPTMEGTKARFRRKEKTNIVEYNGQKTDSNELTINLPFIYSDSLFVNLLSDSLDVSVNIIKYSQPDTTNHHYISGSPADTIFRKMMLESDNFLAEQLLLLCAQEVLDTLHTQKIIDLVKDSLFRDAPEELLWYDGSGLSRYNQITPRSMVYLLNKIDQEIPKKKWQTVFTPMGDEALISQNSESVISPYIYAKSGGMRNVYCLSGFLFTKNKKRLIFSFMNNHIPENAYQWRLEVLEILSWLHHNL